MLGSVIGTESECKKFLEFQQNEQIKEHLLPNLVGKDTLYPQFREISSLPLKMGKLNIKLPSDHESYLEWSKETSLVLESQDRVIAVTQQEKICKIKKLKTDRTNQKKTNLVYSLKETDKYAIDLASEKAASNWLNALPLSRYNFNLIKSKFRDGIYLRYGWEPTKNSLTCACGANFNFTHALHCAKGGYTHIRHNEIRDIRQPHERGLP